MTPSSVSPVMPYGLLVTFVEPTDGGIVLPMDRTRFWASFNEWKDERPVEDTLADIHELSLESWTHPWAAPTDQQTWSTGTGKTVSIAPTILLAFTNFDGP
jgi:hypothetical protein